MTTVGVKGLNIDCFGNLMLILYFYRASAGEAMQCAMAL